MKSVKKTPAKTDQKLAKRSLSALEQIAKSRQKSTKPVEITVAGDEAHIKIPGIAFEHLQKILQSIAEGKAISLISNDEELTTQEAADFLKVPVLIW